MAELYQMILPSDIFPCFVIMRPSITESRPKWAWSKPFLHILMAFEEGTQIVFVTNNYTCFNNMFSPNYLALII